MLVPEPLTFSTMEMSSFKEPRPEGYDENFDPPLESTYECPICLLGMREPVQTDCGHRFCRGCILRSLRGSGSRCPVDNKHLDESHIYPDNFAKREILSRDVFCRCKKEHGCSWKGPLGKLEDHMKECNFVDVSCPKNCGKELKGKDVKQHLDEECPNRVVPCDHCDEEMQWNGLESHFKTCPKFPLSCGLCGKEKVTNEMMEEHLDKECPQMEVRCPFSALGCTFEGLRAKVNAHVEEQLASHTIAMARAFDALKSEPQRNASRLTTSGTESLQRQACGNSGASSRELTTHCQQQRSEVDELRRINDVLSNELQHMKRWLKESDSRRERGLQELSLKFNRWETKLSEFEGRVCNGSYTWKIGNYRKCRQDAITGAMTAIHSPAFYTDLYGYKLCMRINLNGVDGGVGKHVALFVHMMQGDYDNVLEWPFTGRIALSILDQSDAEFRHHISEHFVAKPNLLAFQRPTSLRNYKGYGYVEFAPIEHIRDPQYVKNNTMLVRIQIFQ